MIKGIQQIPLKQMADERGKVMHMLRINDPHFRQFGEIYFSQINPGFIKAWKFHKNMTINIAVPVGRIKVVAYDDRDGSSTRHEVVEYVCGEDDYKLLIIPPKIWYGFECLSSDVAIIANCATIAHCPSESITLPADDPLIPYKWE